MSQRLVIDAAGCDGCIGCVRSCPTGALELADRGSAAVITWDIGRCIFCHRCEWVCPRDAVSFSESGADFGDRTARRGVMELGAVACAVCGRAFSFFNPDQGPRPNAEKNERLDLCPRCRQRAGVRAETARKRESTT